MSAFDPPIVETRELYMLPPAKRATLPPGGFTPRAVVARSATRELLAVRSGCRTFVNFGEAFLYATGQLDWSRWHNVVHRSTDYLPHVRTAPLCHCTVKRVGAACFAARDIYKASYKMSVDTLRAPEIVQLWHLQRYLRELPVKIAMPVYAPEWLSELVLAIETLHWQRATRPAFSRKPAYLD